MDAKRRKPAKGEVAPEAGVTFEIRDGFAVAKLSGSLAGAECAPLLDGIAERAEKAPLPGGADNGVVPTAGVILDLTDVSYVGSFVLRKFLRLGETCRKLGRPMAIVSATEPVFRVIELLSLTAALGYYRTVEEAMSALGGQGG